MKYILDTDTVSLFHRGNLKVIARVASVDPSICAISVFTKIELLRARFEFVLKAANGKQLLTAQDWLETTEGDLAVWDVLPVSDAAADRFDELLKLRRLRRIGRADLLIASLGLAHRATVVTRNIRDFSQVPNLSIENWAD